VIYEKVKDTPAHYHLVWFPAYWYCQL